MVFSSWVLHVNFCVSLLYISYNSMLVFILVCLYELDFSTVYCLILRPINGCHREIGETGNSYLEYGYLSENSLEREKKWR